MNKRIAETMSIIEVLDKLSTEDKARAAAEIITQKPQSDEVATRADIQNLKKDMGALALKVISKITPIQWMIGFNVAMTAAIMLKLFN